MEEKKINEELEAKVDEAAAEAKELSADLAVAEEAAEEAAETAEEAAEEAVEEVADAAEEAAEEVVEAEADQVAEAAEEAEAAFEDGSAAAADIAAEAKEMGADIAVAGTVAEETVEEAVEEAEEAVEEVADTAEEVAEEADEIAEAAEEAEAVFEKGSAAAEDIAAEAYGIQEDILAAGAAIEAEEIAEAKAEAEAFDAAEELAEVRAEAAKKGPAVKEPPIIKKKRKLDKTNVIVIIVCAVIVLAVLAFCGYKLGYFKGKVVSKQKLEDYSTIEVLKEAVDIPDELVDQYINNILSSMSETVQVTEGVVADGDQLNIDYVGKLSSTGEKFDGGSAEGQSLTIGSGTMIDGFESGLIGAKIGETTTIHVTFPEDYMSTDLAGKDADFDITVNYRTETQVPELTDEFAHEYSHNYLEKELKTADELREYARDYLYNYYLHNAMFDDLQKKQTVISYDEEIEAELVEYSKGSLDYYAAMYGTTADQYAAMYGAADAESYAKEEAHYYMDSIMLIDQIVKDKKITWTDDEFRQAVALYMARQGYSGQYTVDEFLEMSGETWQYLYENLEFKFDLAMKALEPNVVFVDELSDAEETTAAAEETTTQAAK